MADGFNVPIDVEMGFGEGLDVPIDSLDTSLGKGKRKASAADLRDDSIARLGSRHP